MTKQEHRVLDVVRRRGGMARTCELLAAGIQPRALYHVRDTGLLLRVSRGLYRLPEHTLDDPDLATVAVRVPCAVICLVSALSLHGITTQIPDSVDVALPRGMKRPRLDHPPIKVHWMSGTAYSEGIESSQHEGYTVRLYSVEKSIADCFKFRNKLGMDVVLEAFKLYRERYRFDGNRIMHFARICRVAEVMRPYLEASL